jgi:hypothetical protein
MRSHSDGRWILGTLACLLLLQPLLTHALELPSSAELARQCRGYVDQPEGQEARFCAAYLQGFIDGSPLVAIRQGPKATETFSQRAARTRLGRPVAARPPYCIDSTVQMSELIGQVLAQAEKTPPRDDTDASVLLHAMLARFYKCPSR